MGAASRRLAAVLGALWHRSRSAHWRARHQQLSTPPESVGTRPSKARGERRPCASRALDAAHGSGLVPKHQTPLASKWSGPAGKTLQLRVTRELCRRVGSPLLGSDSHSQVIPSRSGWCKRAAAQEQDAAR